jgi:NAD(P)-dependent dehydrogenase (short-subunit alcohol dehydrogenase family)
MSAALFDVANRTAVVTGGTRGVGFQIAGGLLDAGMRVIIASRKAAACEEAAAELSSRGEVSAVPADVATAAGADALAEAVGQRFGGRLDVLVNNAGTYWMAPLDDFPEQAWDKLFDVNVKGVFRLTTALLPALRAVATPEWPARIVNIGSVDGMSVPGYVPGEPYVEAYSYSATKAALHMLTRHLAQRLACEHITVNALALGPFDSKITAPMLGEPETRAQMAAAIPLGRIGAPSDLAGTVQYLVSAAGSYVTGVILPLDGGSTGCR